MKVKLSSVGNINHNQNPNKKLFGKEDDKWVEVSSFRDASNKCKEFINQNNLGSSNWAGGKIKDSTGKTIARVSYNGRVWEGGEYKIDSKEIIDLD